jgi:Uncharacterised protein family (UPF0175)
MTIQLEIPEDIAQRLAAQGEDVSRAAVEAFGLEEYRGGRLTEDELRRVLGYQTRMEVEGFLKQHQVWLEFSAEDFERETEIIEKLHQKRREEKIAGQANEQRDARAG